MVWLLPLMGKSQTFFDNYYNVGYNNLMSCNVVATEDSNFIFVNYVQDSVTGRQDAGFITIDKNGNEILHNSFNYFNSTWNTFFNRSHFIQVSKSSFFLSGADPNANTMICKISKTGLDTIRTIKIQDVNYSIILNSFIKIHSNRFFLVGNIGNYATSIGSPFILDLDSNLTILNQYTVSTLPLLSLITSAMINPISHKLILQGNRYTGQYPILLGDLDTLCTAGTSSLSVSSLTTNIAHIYFSAMDTSYVCVGAKKTAKIGGNDLWKLFISKYDRNFNLLWHKMYGDNAYMNFLDKAVILSDGSIVASGMYSKLTSQPLANGDYNGVILKVDKDGHFRWMREYSHYGPGNYLDGFYGIDRALDKGFILCGYVSNLPNAKAWAVKTDSLGCVTPGCASSTITVDSLIIPKDTTVTTSLPEFNVSGFTFQVYPNPAKGDFVVETVSDEPKILSICDLQGREIKQIVLGNKETVSASDLSPGVYLLQLYREGQLLSTKKVVVIR